MHLNLEPTEHVFQAGGVTVRLWQGTDASGEPVIALVAYPGRAPVVVEADAVPP